MFSEEYYVPPPPPNRSLSRQASLLLFIVSQWSITNFKGEHVQTQFGSNFENTKCCGYCEYKLKVIKTMYLCKFGVEKPTGSEDRAQKRLNLQFLRMMTLKWGDLES